MRQQYGLLSRLLFFLCFLQPLYSCSIVGYTGEKACKESIQEGLDRLSYRGYDSAGFACLDDEEGLVVVKAEGGFPSSKRNFKRFPVTAESVSVIRDGLRMEQRQNETHTLIPMSKELLLLCITAS